MYIYLYYTCRKYVVVEFPEETNEDGKCSSAIVPKSWIDGDSCYWPTQLKGRMLDKVIAECGDIDFALSSKCPITIKYKTSMYASLCFDLCSLINYNLKCIHNCGNTLLV